MRILFFIVFFSSAIFSLPCFAADAKPLTYSECLSAAIVNNETIAIEQEAVNQARFYRLKAGGDMLPVISASFNRGIAEYNEKSVRNWWQTVFSARQPVFYGGEKLNMLSYWDSETASREFALTTAKTGVAGMTAGIFFTLAAAQANEADIAEALSLMNTRLSEQKEGEWLAYRVNVTSAGVYDMAFRVACLNAGGNFHLEVDGSNVTGTMAVPDTTGWQTWTTVTKTGVSLTAGIHTFKLVMDSIGGTSGCAGNFNWMSFVEQSTPTATATATNTRTITNTTTRTATSTATFTYTLTATATATARRTNSVTPADTATNTTTQTSTVTLTSTSTATMTLTATASQTPTNSPTNTFTASRTTTIRQARL